MIATLGTVGGVAQLGERTVRIRKVESSILFVSTKKGDTTSVVSPFFMSTTWVELRKGVSLFQGFASKTWTIAILAQNRSSDPLRLHPKSHAPLFGTWLLMIIFV